MMWRHAESLMAGAVALYLNFNTKSMTYSQQWSGRYENDEEPL